MPFYKSTITFQPELSVGTTNFLLGEVMNKIIAEINIYAEWKSMAVPVINTFAFINGAKTIVRLTGSWITDGFTVGDTIQVTNANAANNILNTVATITALTLTCTGNFGFSESSDTAIVHGITPITDADFFYNLIQNSDTVTFVSIIDPLSDQKFNATGLNCEDTTPIVLVPQGMSQAWVNGSATIEGTSASDWDDPSTGTFQQGFKINHTFFILPWYNADTDNIVPTFTTGLPLPDRFAGGECLKYVFEIDGYFSPVDISRKQTLTDSGSTGNTGWYNERFNGGPPKYHAHVCTFTDTLTSDVVADIQYCRDTNFSMTIHSIANKFSNNNTKFVLNFSYLPQNSSQFQATTTDLKTNFMFDRCLQTVGAASVDGDNFGTDTQVLENVIGTYVNTGEIIISGTINFSAAIATAIPLLSSTNMKYLFAVEIQDHTAITTLSDKVTCMNNDIGDFWCDLDEAVFLVSDYVHFNDHPNTGTSDGWNNARGWIEDGIGMHCVFSIDMTNSPTFDKLSLVIEATHATYTDFELERKDFTALESTTRGFKLPTGTEDDKNIVELIRRADLDYGNLDFYEVKYGFKFRWEDWININVPLPTNIPINKRKQDWYAFSTSVAGWSVKFNVYCYTTIEVYQTIHKHISNCTIHDYGILETNCVIQTFNQLGVDTSLHLLGYENTHIKATITGALGGALKYGILEIEKYQNGGLLQIRQISTIYVPESDSLWIGDPINNLAILTVISGNQVTLEADINYLLLDLSHYTYKISARIGWL